MEILYAILEILIPLAFEAIGEWFFWDWSLNSRTSRYVTYAASFLGAAAAGAISAILWESGLAQNKDLAVAVVVVVPFVTGVAATKIAEVAFRRKRDQLRYGHFWVHYLTMLGFLGGRLFIPFSSSSF